MSGDLGDAMGGTIFGEGRRSSNQGSSRMGSDWRSDDTSDAWQDARNRGSRTLSRMEDSAEDAFYATRRYIYHHPVQALLGVTALAFAVGALWRLGSRERRFGQDFFERVSDYVEPQMRAMRRKW